jgi:hypothetical protein
MAQNQGQQAVPPAALVVPEAQDNKSFIIVISRDMEEADIALLKEYGRVIIFDHKVYRNVAINTLDFDYLIVDLREKEDRHYIEQMDAQVLENYNLVSLCYSFQTEDRFHDELSVDNIITKLPEKQAFKAEFDRLLLQKKITRPNATLSCIKSVIKVLQGDWN